MSQPKKRLFKYSPFLSAGVIAVDKLKELVERMEAEGAKNVKLGGEIIFVWDTADEPAGFFERAPYEANEFKYGGVRPVKMCSAETFCQRFQRPVLDLALEIDRRFHDAALDMKLVIGVAGCQRSCSEPATKDIGVIAHPQGYEILIGGAAGMRPRLAESLTIVPTREDVLEIIGRILDYCKKWNKKGARLGRLIEKQGREQFERDVLQEAPLPATLAD